MEKAQKLIRTEIIISTVLRLGVIACSCVIAIGLVSRTLHLGSVTESSREIVSKLLSNGLVALDPPHTPARFWEGVSHLQPDTIMALGLLLLILLPIARVGMTVVLFFLERDWAFLVITLIVFSVLIFGISFGRAL